MKTLLRPNVRLPLTFQLFNFKLCQSATYCLRNLSSQSYRYPPSIMLSGQHATPYNQRILQRGFAPTEGFHSTPSRKNEEPTPTTAEEYHVVADATMDSLYNHLEVLAEIDTTVDVEFSAGVLTLSLPKGTYVINKQPPNRQIWLSSPVSGPKRFDWVDGEWVYSRDGTNMRKLLEEEIGVAYQTDEL